MCGCSPMGLKCWKNYIDKIIFYQDKLRFQKCLSIFTNIHGLVRYNGRLGSTKFLNEQICFKIGQNRDCNFQILTVLLIGGTSLRRRSYIFVQASSLSTIAIHGSFWACAKRHPAPSLTPVALFPLSHSLLPNYSGRAGTVALCSATTRAEAAERLHLAPR